MRVGVGVRVGVRVAVRVRVRSGLALTLTLTPTYPTLSLFSSFASAVASRLLPPLLALAEAMPTVAAVSPLYLA